jgi:hypothetical protein
MGKVIRFNHRRPRGRKLPTVATEEPPRRGPLKPTVTIVLAFSAAAIAFTAAVVAFGATSWDEAVPLLALVSVVALIKIVFANLIFFAILQADSQDDSRTGQENRSTSPTVRQRPIPLRIPGAVASRPLSSEKIAHGGGLARLARKSIDGPPPRAGR